MASSMIAFIVEIHVVTSLHRLLLRPCPAIGPRRQAEPERGESSFPADRRPSSAWHKLCRNTDFQDVESIVEDAMCRKWKPRLLVCTSPAMLATAHETFSRHYRCSFSLRLEDALSSLDANPSAIVCDLHFDEGRMFDFFTDARTHPTACNIPFVVVRTSRCHTPDILRGMQTAFHTLGIDAFVDAFQVRQDHGHEAALREVLETVKQALIRTKP